MHRLVYGTRCTVYVIRYTDCGRGGPEKASTRLARTAVLARSILLRSPRKIYTVGVRATARRVPFFICGPRRLSIRPLTSRFRVQPGKRRSYTPAKHEDNVAIVPT